MHPLNARLLPSSPSPPAGRRSSSASSGFLGCVRLLSNAIERLKDTGYQRLDLVADNNNPLPVKGQIVISLMSRDGQGTGEERERKKRIWTDAR